jgi:CBS-domain-containing membrane protein
MREPAVADLMTRQVITVVPDAPFRELVGTMLAHDPQALPVIDLVGQPHRRPAQLPGIRPHPPLYRLPQS